MTSLASLESKVIHRKNSKSGQVNNKILNSEEKKECMDKKIEIYDPLEDVIHSPKASLLSSTSGYTNYRGLLNLCIILLVINLFKSQIFNFFSHYYP
jgi:hypothetical protein